LVDLQNDFVVGGALAVSDGMAVVEITNRLMADFDLVVATQDWHPADHKSFVSKPPMGAAIFDTISASPEPLKVQRQTLENVPLARHHYSFEPIPWSLRPKSRFPFPLLRSVVSF